MTPEALRRDLGIADPSGLVDRWSDPPPLGGSQAAEHRLPDLVGRWAEDAGLASEAARTVERHAAERWAAPAWRQFLSLCGAHLYGDAGSVEDLPRATTPESDRGLDRLLLALAGISTLKENHRSLGVPADVTHATVRDLSRWTSYFQSELGSPGISARILGWYQEHIHGRLFEVGRLQFVPSRFEGDVHVYRDRVSGELRVFCSAGRRIGEDGLVPAEEFPDGGCTTTSFSPSPQVRGHQVAPSGHIAGEVTDLPGGEWICELTAGTPVLDIHIPTGGSLDLVACESSIHRGVSLLSRLFPDHLPVAMVCEAWLLDPRLEAVLSRDSNILRFARRFFRYSVPGDPREAIARVFGERARTEGVAQAPRDTRFQRRLATFVESGGRIGGAGGFYRISDLPFRDTVYLHTM